VGARKTDIPIGTCILSGRAYISLSTDLASQGQHRQSAEKHMRFDLDRRTKLTRSVSII